MTPSVGLVDAVGGVRSATKWLISRRSPSALHCRHDRATPAPPLRPHRLPNKQAAVQNTRAQMWALRSIPQTKPLGRNLPVDDVPILHFVVLPLLPPLARRLDRCAGRSWQAVAWLAGAFLAVSVDDRPACVVGAGTAT